ncbi:hypothetical protein JYU34_002313 [Plutella xylostella]|uniref:Gustatory receptor n=1 Tax=Plutella xylostella TaxID=51655 RepID=A0ABQ7R1V6_PLUXY|nr:hypothetical protein JYU34_002313 [Plutella xylostella]
MESTSAQVKPMLMVSLCCGFPKIMCVVYIVLWSYKVSAVPIWYIFMIAPEVMMWAFLPCLVGVFVEIIKYEIDNIKCILSNELIETTNGCHREQREQFLRYIQLRPFSYSVWRLLRVDGALPAALLALLSTYLIVIIQFTELYE